jgi:hypothetical protein
MNCEGRLADIDYDESSDIDTEYDEDAEFNIMENMMKDMDVNEENIIYTRETACETVCETASMYRPENYDYIISIDIGIKNLAIVLIEITPSREFSQIIWFENIDITDFGHSRDWPIHECQLYHDKTVCDYLEHIFYIHHEIFRISRHVLIERQPIQGITSVEQLIFSRFRDKAILISPNSMHKYMGWKDNNYDYEKRKQMSVLLAYRYINAATPGKETYRPWNIENFDNLIKLEKIGEARAHDIADAICLFLFWLTKARAEWEEEQQRKKLKKEIEEAKQKGKFHTHLYIDTFRFLPSTTIKLSE